MGKNVTSKEQIAAGFDQAWKQAAKELEQRRGASTDQGKKGNR